MRNRVWSVKRRMADQGSTVRAAEMRLAEARQAAEAERARYDELEAAFQRLDRELEAGSERPPAVQ